MKDRSLLLYVTFLQRLFKINSSFNGKKVALLIKVTMFIVQ